MKTLFSILALLTITISSIAQSGDYDELMRKSRKARTTSTIMIATGPVIAAAGIGTLIYGLVSKSDIFNEYDYNGNPISTKNYNTEIIVGAGGAAVGIALALTSIHFTNKATDLKREARKVKLKTSFDRISIPGFQYGLASNQTRQYKLSLVIPLVSR